MAASAGFFILGDASQTPQLNGQDVLACPAVDGRAKWPSFARRGRPRKDGRKQEPPAPAPSETVTELEKQPLAFIDHPSGRRSNDPNVQKIVRVAAMRDRRKKSYFANQSANETQIGEADPESEYFAYLVARGALQDSYRQFNSPYPIYMEPAMRRLLHLFITFATKQFFPIEAFWGYYPATTFWLPMALSDECFLAACLFSADYYDVRLRRYAIDHHDIGSQFTKEQPSTINILAKALKVLNGRLHGRSAVINDATIAAVAGLAITECAMGNINNWRAHMEGVKSLVRMRGGMGALRSSVNLHDKICRADMYGSLHLLQSPVITFPHQIVPLPDTSMARPVVDKPIAAGFAVVHADYPLAEDMVWIVDKLFTFSQLLNNLPFTGPSSDDAMKWKEELRAIQYHLLADFDTTMDHTGHLSLCRIGVLLFTGVVQDELWLSPLSDDFLYELKIDHDPQWAVARSIYMLRLWVIFLTAPLMPESATRTWLLTCMMQITGQLSLSSWEDVHGVLSSFAWVDAVQDQAAQALWNVALKMALT